MKDRERHQGIDYKGIKYSVFLYFLKVYILCVLFLSCGGDSKYSDFEKTETGILYKFHTHSEDTVHPKYGEIVRLKMLTRIGDSTLDNTGLIYPEGARKNLAEPLFKGAVEEAICMMVIGDSATFLVSTDSINKYYPAKDSSRNFKSNEYLVFDIKLVNIQTIDDVEWEEQQKRKDFLNDRKEKGPKELSQYIADNHIEVKPKESGLYFIETTKGSGASPKDQDTVVVHYTGMFLNGTIFDSSVKRNHPLTFVVNDKGKMSMISGWNEAIKMMKKSGKATLIIPHTLAYDSAGVLNPKNGKYFIPPYSPMKFDIHLLDIKHKK